MISWLLKATFATVCCGLLGYVAVTVPIGRRTLFEHAIAIAATEPARDLAEDVGTATRTAVDRVKGALQTH